jgi:hypothetical protein
MEREGKTFSVVPIGVDEAVVRSPDEPHYQRPHTRHFPPEVYDSLARLAGIDAPSPAHTPGTHRRVVVGAEAETMHLARIAVAI